jgi:hypothetical protein
MISRMWPWLAADTHEYTPLTTITSASAGPMVRSAARVANDASSKWQLARPARAARPRPRSTWPGLWSKPHTSTVGLAAATMQAEIPLAAPRSSQVSGRARSNGGWPWRTDRNDSHAGLRSVSTGSK